MEIFLQKTFKNKIAAMNFKSRFLAVAVLVMLLAVSCITTQKVYAQDDYNNDYNNNYSQSDNNYQGSEDEPLIQPDQDVTFDQFYSDLSPYGRWVDYPSYGRVWVCNVSGFRPYSTGGHWAYTHFGWTWVSDYNWGWAPFHYGRWAFDASYGWLWVPGYTWGPAWVSWRNSNDYYGWAPLSPGINVSVGIGFGSGIAAANWVFMPHRYMGYHTIAPYYVNPSRNTTIIHNTTIINYTNVYKNTMYVVGPQRQEVERYTRRQIQPQNIYVSNRQNAQGQDNRGIHLYRPQPQPNTVVNNRNVVRNNVQNNITNVIQNNNNNNVQQPVNRNNLPARTWNSQQQQNRPTDAFNNNQAQQNLNNRQQALDNQKNNNLQQQNVQQQRMQEMQRRQQVQNAQQQDNNRQQQMMMQQQRQQEMQNRQQQQEMMMRQQQQDRYQQQLEQRRQQQMRQQESMQQRQEMMQRQQQMQNRNFGNSFPQNSSRQFQPQQRGGRRNGF